MTVTVDPFYDWVLEVAHGYYPVRPATYGANPYRPDPQLPSRFESMAALRGGWTPAKKRTRRKRRR